MHVMAWISLGCAIAVAAVLTSFAAWEVRSWIRALRAHQFDSHTAQALAVVAPAGPEDDPRLLAWIGQRAEELARQRQAGQRDE